MAFENPLDPILASWQITRVSLTVARKSTAPRSGIAWSEAPLAGPPLAADFETAERNLDELYVIALWSAFERWMVEYVQSAVESGIASRSHPNQFKQALLTYLSESVEDWSSPDIMNLFKDLVGKKEMDQLVSIRRHRNWLAHRNPNRASMRQITPEYTYRILTTILEAIHHAT